MQASDSSDFQPYPQTQAGELQSGELQSGELQSGKSSDLTPPTCDEGFAPLDPREITADRLVGYPIFGIIWLGLIASSSASFFVVEDWWYAPLLVSVWLLLGAFFFFLAHFWPKISHRHISWKSSDVGMEIRYGVLWKHRVVVPIARVQHVDVSQGPLQRSFDLGKLIIYTAGTKNSSVELDGLQHAQALRLRDQLIAQKESLDVL